MMVVPRTSRYVNELGADERGELERRAREVSAPWRDVQRARMILYAAEGMADIEIAGRLDCHPESVSHDDDAAVPSVWTDCRTGRGRVARAVSSRSRSPRWSRWRASCRPATSGRWGALRVLNCTGW